MKKVACCIALAGTLWLIGSCSTLSLWSPYQLSDVELVSVDTVGDCYLRYTILFSHGAGSENYQYWVGLRTPDRSWTKTSATKDTVPPLNNYQMSFVLSQGDAPPPPTTLEAFAAVSDASASGYGTTSGGTVPYPAFPTECCPFSIHLSDGTGEVQPNTCVFISEAAEMPPLTASVTGTSGTIDWSLTVTYNRSGRNDTSSYQTSLNAASDWDIAWSSMISDVRGGEATLVAYSRDDSCSQVLSFGIRAYNPSEFAVELYIDALPSAMWYDKYVAKHETCCQVGRTFLQFNEDYNYDCDPSDLRYTPNESSGGDHGFGIYQLTFFGAYPNERTPNAQELWSWKQNVLSGKAWLDYQLGRVVDTMLIERYWAAQWYFEDTSSAIYSKVPDQTEGNQANVTFSDGTTKVAEHAMTMKRFNGRGLEGMDYCRWDFDTHEWVIFRYASYEDPYGTIHKNYYVNDVCSNYP